METLILIAAVVFLGIVIWRKGITLIDLFPGGRGGGGRSGGGGGGGSATAASSAQNFAQMQAQQLQQYIAAARGYLEQTGQREAVAGWFPPQPAFGVPDEHAVAGWEPATHALHAPPDLAALQVEAAGLAGYLESTGQSAEFEDATGLAFTDFQVGEGWSDEVWGSEQANGWEQYPAGTWGDEQTAWMEGNGVLEDATSFEFADYEEAAGDDAGIVDGDYSEIGEE